MREKMLARCAAYRLLLEETPVSRRLGREYDREQAATYISLGMPDQARWHMCGSGVPKEYIISVDTLIG